MTINIHPLQESSYYLLRELYFNKKLPLTKAMLSVLNGYYPSIEDVLATLSYYKDDSLVVSFAEKNASMIESAGAAIAPLNSGAANAESLVLDDSDIDGIFGSSFELVDAYKCMKGVSLEELEGGLSSELSRLCGEDLIFEISSIQESSNGSRTGVKLAARVKPKNLFR